MTSKFQVSTLGYSKFHSGLDYMARLCLKKTEGNCKISEIIQTQEYCFLSCHPYSDPVSLEYFFLLVQDHKLLAFYFPLIWKIIFLKNAGSFSFNTACFFFFFLGCRLEFSRCFFINVMFPIVVKFCLQNIIPSGTRCRSSSHWWYQFWLDCQGQIQFSHCILTIFPLATNKQSQRHN